MKTNITSLALGLLLVAAPVWAADIDGKWSGSIDTPNGAVPINYELKAEGEKLTGTSSGPDGSPVAIEGGKISGNKLSFSLTIDFGAGPTKFDYTGEVSATELKLHSSFMDMPLEFTLKKS
jgi:hypothetical protein